MGVLLLLTSPPSTLRVVGSGSTAGPTHSRKWRNAAMMSAPGEIRTECAQLRAVQVLTPEADFTFETKIQHIRPKPDDGAVPTNSFRRIELVRGLPMTLPVDLTSQNFFRDPAATVRRLQAAGPVVEVGFPMVGRVWMTTTQEMASRVLKDGKLFTMRKDDGAVPGMRWWMPRIIGVLTNHMLTVDEPDHARLRGIVDEAFCRRAVLDMEPRVRAIADELVLQLTTFLRSLDLFLELIVLTTSTLLTAAQKPLRR